MSKKNLVAAITLWFVIACGALGISCKGVPDVNENDLDNEQPAKEQQEDVKSSENKQETYKSMGERFFTERIYKRAGKFETFFEAPEKLQFEKYPTVGFGNRYVYDEAGKDYSFADAPKKLKDEVTKRAKAGDKQWFLETQTKQHIKFQMRKFKNKWEKLKEEYAKKGIKLEKELPEPEDWPADKVEAMLWKGYQRPDWMWDHTFPELVKLELQLKDLEKKLKNGEITEKQAKEQKEQIENKMANAFSYYVGGKGVHDDGTYGRCYWMGGWYIGRINGDTIMRFGEDIFGNINTKEDGDTNRTDSYIITRHEKVIEKAGSKKSNGKPTGIPVKEYKTDKKGNILKDKKGKKLYTIKYVDKIEATVEYKIDEESIERNIEKVLKNKTTEVAQQGKEQKETKNPEKKEEKKSESKTKNTTENKVTSSGKFDTPEIKKYKKRIEQNGTDYKAYSELSYIYWKSGKLEMLEEGSKYLGEVYNKNKHLLDDKKLSGFYFNVGSLRETLGDNYKKQNKNQEAMKQYKKALNNFNATDNDKAIKRLENKIKDLNKLLGFNKGIENVKKLSYFKVGDKIYAVDEDTHVVGKVEYDSTKNIARVIDEDTNKVIETLNNPKELFKMGGGEERA